MCVCAGVCVCVCIYFVYSLDMLVSIHQGYIGKVVSREHFGTRRPQSMGKYNIVDIMYCTPVPLLWVVVDVADMFEYP